MGQYYLIVNTSKKQFVYPPKFGDGLKLMEFGCSADGTMTALAILLASGNGRGGGDLDSENEIIGSWAGDSIVTAGDYDDEGKFTDEPRTLYDVAYNTFEDVSEKVLAAMLVDKCIAEELEFQFANSYRNSPFRTATRKAKRLINP